MKIRVRPDRMVRMADFRPRKVAVIELALGRSKMRNSEELSDLRELSGRTSGCLLPAEVIGSPRLHCGTEDLPSL